MRNNMKENEIASLVMAKFELCQRFGPHVPGKHSQASSLEVERTVPLETVLLHVLRFLQASAFRRLSQDSK